MIHPPEKRRVVKITKNARDCIAPIPGVFKKEGVGMKKQQMANQPFFNSRYSS